MGMFGYLYFLTTSTLLSPTEPRYLLRLHLGLPINPLSTSCNCCGHTISSLVEKAGDHALCCVRAGYVKRHYVICDQVRYLLASGFFRSFTEVPVYHDRSLRVDLVVDEFHEGRSLCLDVHITHSLTHRLRERSLVEAEERKLTT